MSNGPNVFFKSILDLLNIETKQGLEFLTAILYLIFSIFFAIFFIIDLQIFSNINEFYLYVLVFIAIYSIRFFLFSNDVLYNCDPQKNKYCRAFQEAWPSNYIAEKFDLSKKDAKFYWFENVFNYWGNEKHPRHGQWKRTLKRGYSCRLVHRVIKLLEYLIILSIILGFIYQLLPKLIEIHFLTIDTKVQYQIAYLIILIFIYLFIRLTNRVSENNLTGVWRQYFEINDMHRKWIDENIPTLDSLKNYNK